MPFANTNTFVLADSPVKDAINDFLVKNPLINSLMFLVLGLVLAGFAYSALKHKVTKTKYGKRIEGKEAVRKGYIMCAAAVMALSVSLFQGIKGISKIYNSPRNLVARAANKVEADLARMGLPAMADAKKHLDRLKPSKFVGANGNHANRYSGGVMVGMIVTTNDDNSIGSLIPIFQNRDKRKTSVEIGQRGPSYVMLLAEPDYAVVDVNMYVGTTIEAIQLEFAGFDKNGMNNKNRSKSEWVGNMRGTEAHLNTRQNFIGGFVGQSGVRGFGMQLLMYDKSDWPMINSLRPASAQSSPDDLLAQLEPVSQDSQPGPPRERSGFAAPNSLPPSNSSTDRPNSNIDSNIASNDSADHSQRPAPQDSLTSPSVRTPDISEMRRPPRPSGRSNKGFSTANNFANNSANDPAIEPGEAIKLGPAEIPLPPLRFKLEKAERSEYVGHSLSGQQYLGHGPPGSVLVGIRVGETDDLNSEIRNLRPIYQLGDKYYYGEMVGSPGGRPVELLAKPGFVVGGCLVQRAGVNLKSLQLVYLKIDPKTGRLNQSDRYLSDMVGASFGIERDLFANGWHVVGIYGREDDAVCGIGLAAIKARLDRSGENGFRTWTSSDGEFSVEAKFGKKGAQTVELIKRDNSTIQVPLSKLSEADLNWLKNKK